MPESATEDRLRIRHDVVFAKTGDGVLIRHSGGGFLLRGNSIYEWLTALSPFLDGTRSENELVSDLDESKAGMIHNLLDALRERNVVSEVSGRVIGDDDSLAPFRSQIAYIDHYVGHGVRRFERFRSARIRVDGFERVFCSTDWRVLSSRMTECRIPSSTSASSVPLTGMRHTWRRPRSL